MNERMNEFLEVIRLKKKNPGLSVIDKNWLKKIWQHWKHIKANIDRNLLWTLKNDKAYRQHPQQSYSLPDIDG